MILPPEIRSELFIIGILGGVCSGKSTVGDMFVALGAQRLDADAIAHDVLRTEEVKRHIVQKWGERLLVQGEIDRRTLAEAVFQDAQQLKALEDLMHPLIRQRILERLKQCASNAQRVILLDVPLLDRSPLLDLCHLVLFVDTALPVRKQRARVRGWAPEEVDKRDAHQTALGAKKALAHRVIDNGAAIEKTRSRVQQIWDQDIPQIFKNKSNVFFF